MAYKGLISVQSADLMEEIDMVAPVNARDRGDLFIEVRQIVGDVLQLGRRTEDLRTSTHLIGNLPELDSMAVLAVITALEERFHIIIRDDDDMSDALATLGSLTKYVEDKLFI